MNRSGIDTSAALQYFTSHDPLMARLLEAALAAPEPIELPAPKPPERYFASIVSSIVSQQISVRAADAVSARVVALVGEVTPARILAVDETTLKACGLSSQKTRYIRHNAAVWHELPIHAFATMDDEAVIAELVQLYGIGRWTAEMFLMFSLARPDVFSFGDLGLMQSLYQHYNFRPHWTRKVTTTVAAWSPHRTLASLTLWWHKDGGPVVL